MDFLQPSIVKKVNGQDMTFTFTFRTLAVLASSTDMASFDEVTPFEQIPMLLYAGLVSGKNDLPDGFSLNDIDSFLFAMTPDDVAAVFQHGTQALGFIGQTMGKLIDGTKPSNGQVAKRKNG